MKRSKHISAIRLKPPIVYYGGKIRLAQWIVSVMMRYAFKRYIEPFGGSAAVLFAKPPSQCEIYNDIFSDVFTFYKVLRSPSQFEQLLRLIESTPYSRQVYNDARGALANGNLSDVERAWCFFICIRQSFSNLMNSWSTPSECSHTVAAVSYQRAIIRLREAHERLKHVHFENMDALDCIKKYANENSLIYVDPPYISGTRVAPKTYRHEFSDEQHKELVRTLLEVPGAKILSGYEHPIYAPLLNAGWTLEKKTVCCHASGNSKKTYRVECLYCSPIKCTTTMPTISNRPMSKSTGKNPFDRKVFFSQHQTDFFSLRDIQHLVRAEKLSLFDFVFDTDGGSYSVENIVLGESPKWAMSRVNDPMLHGLPSPSEADVTLSNELLCEDGILEMPEEPAARTVNDFLSREPRIANMVANAERFVF